MSRMKISTRVAVAIIERAMQSENVRDAIWYGAKEFFTQHHCQASTPGLQKLPGQYFHNGVSEPDATENKCPIFITARFRSGSTFLWNLLRNISSTTAYYEPLNENRWYMAASAAAGVDDTHIGVEDYRQEYAGMEALDRHFREEWSFRELYMDHTYYDPALFHYLTYLVEHAEGHPVLQFNRMDFRLPWLRANFPAAKIIHLYRHPRETWMSILSKAGSDIPLVGEWGHEYYKNLFYTYEWANDLKRVFSFLEHDASRHPYEIHYHLWRLSFNFGVYYSDYSLSYEELVEKFPMQLSKVLNIVGIEDADFGKMLKMNKGKAKYRWHEYASTDWFEEIEQRCEREQRAFFAGSGENRSIHLA